MGRAQYSDDLDERDLALWRGAVQSALRGARGQRFLRDLVAALEAMPVHELIADELECPEGVCALGALGRYRGLLMTELDPNDYAGVAHAFQIAEALAREVEYVNDEGNCYRRETNGQRHERVLRWAKENLR